MWISKWAYIISLFYMGLTLWDENILVWMFDITN